jgi:hypothetical protein
MIHITGTYTLKNGINDDYVNSTRDYRKGMALNPGEHDWIAINNIQLPQSSLSDIEIVEKSRDYQHFGRSESSEYNVLRSGFEEWLKTALFIDPTYCMLRNVAWECDDCFIILDDEHRKYVVNVDGTLKSWFGSDMTMEAVHKAT